LSTAQSHAEILFAPFNANATFIIFFCTFAQVFRNTTFRLTLPCFQQKSEVIIKLKVKELVSQSFFQTGEFLFSVFKMNRDTSMQITMYKWKWKANHQNGVVFLLKTNKRLFFHSLPTCHSVYENNNM
jgi:hypothetical protein